jgi:secreted trypsin-like serine protease
VRATWPRARVVPLSLAAVVVIMAVDVVATTLPGASAATANAAPTRTTMTVPAPPAGLPRLRTIPAHARRTTHGLPRIGRNGPLFQPAAAPSSTSTRIVNGTLASASSYPWIVGIESLFLGWDDTAGDWQTYVSTCTGTVLSSTKVLTAGHCTNDMTFGDTEVIAGRDTLPADFTDLGGGGTVVGVSSVWTHQSFDLNAIETTTDAVPVADVSILTLKQPLPGAYTPISLVAQGDQTPYASGTSATAIGYGITASSRLDQGTLRVATIPIASDANCATAYPTDPQRSYPTGYLSATMTCAGNPPGTPSSPDTCGGDSGGPLVVAGVEVATTDYGIDPCASTYGVYVRLSAYSAAIAADLTRPALVNLDATGDGHADLFARTTGGDLWMYGGSGFAAGGEPAFTTPGTYGSGWQIYSKLFRVTDWNGDGLESIMAETPGGDLYRYDLDANGNLLPRTLIGSGWGAFADIVVTNNWTGDGHPNLLARTRGGDLWIYTSNGSGGWLNPAGDLIGTGWGAFNTVLTPGEWNGDGQQTLIGRTPGGDLFLYESDGHGGWSNGAGTRIGTGWNGFSAFMSPGDFNGDDMMDVVGVTPGGLMFLYTTDGTGNWITGVGQQIGSGWQVFNRIL